MTRYSKIKASKKNQELDMLKFSIIIPVYNVEPFLTKCLDSVVSQVYSNYEALIICDKSADESERIVDEYIKKHKKIKKIYKANTGLAEAKNIGIKHVTGDYILFLDGDDYIEKDLLRVLNNNLYEKPDLLRFQARDILTNDGVNNYSEESFEIVKGTEAFKKIIKYHYIENSWLYAYKTDFWRKNNFNFMKNCIAEDYGLTPLIIAKATTIKCISYIGYNYVQRDNSLMSNTNYDKKIKKMENMLIQARNLKKQLLNIEDTQLILEFINNSMIYYSTTLDKKDFRNYKKILIQMKCFDHLKGYSIKTDILYFLIKNCTWFYYHYITRLLCQR